MMTRFFIYGTTGWLIELFWTGISGIKTGNLNLIGHTSLWMFFIYGTSALFMERVYEIIKDRSVFIRGCVWAVVIFSAEMTGGLVLKKIGIEAWKYETFLSINGLIRLDYLPIWVVVGIMFEKLNKRLKCALI